MISELQELLRSKAIHRYSFIVLTVHYVLNDVACGQYLLLKQDNFFNKVLTINFNCGMMKIIEFK